jgi:hypothetical protein
MKHFIALLLVSLCVPSFAQQAMTTDYDLSAEYNKCMKLKKAGVAGIVVFGATWLAGEAVCVVEQNRYANERWDGNDAMEFARLSNEAKNQPAYKRGVALGAIGFVGTGLSIFVTAKYGTKARRIRDSQGNVVASLGMDMGPQGVSLSLTF